MPKTIPFRVVLTQRHGSRKFFTLFQGRDGSLYIHLYRPEGQAWRIPGGKPPGAGEPMELNFADYKEPGFELHKISFHPSGYIHLTDRMGGRFKDGTRGPAFADMYSPYMLCVLAPCELHHLPFAANEKGMVIDLVLPDEIGPFFATLSLARGEVGPEESRGSLLTPTFILPLRDDYKLVIVLRAVQRQDRAPSVNWPPFPFFLLRTGI